MYTDENKKTAEEIKETEKINSNLIMSIKITYSMIIDLIVIKFQEKKIMWKLGNKIYIIIIKRLERVKNLYTKKLQIKKEFFIIWGLL